MLGSVLQLLRLLHVKGPVIKSIPYVVQPEEIIPGVADYYATTMNDGFDFANILIKTREGRPIKVENNTLAGAKVMLQMQGFMLLYCRLYDSMRLKQPMIAGKPASWEEVDAKVKAGLSQAAAGSEVRLLFLRVLWQVLLQISLLLSLVQNIQALSMLFMMLFLHLKLWMHSRLFMVKELLLITIFLKLM